MDEIKLAESWLSSIGFTVVRWSEVERLIDQCLHLIAKGNNTQKKPTRLNGKLEYIERHLNERLPSFMGHELIMKTKAASQLRDVFVHGIVEGFDNEVIRMSKIQGKEKDYVREVFEVNIVRLNNSQENIDYLIGGWSDVVGFLINESDFNS
ncbi:hypothetical protein ACKC9G_14215 [Pokkaliibacter sp. CJK22405]|uniref:hypothetical protein n=1 Tax=Pokkaliibacter sp. CJK22405 TaxID=3384615 RepID=UPI0039849519